MSLSVEKLKVYHIESERSTSNRSRVCQILHRSLPNNLHRVRAKPTESFTSSQSEVCRIIYTELEWSLPIASERVRAESIESYAQSQSGFSRIRLLHHRLITASVEQYCVLEYKWLYEMKLLRMRFCNRLSFQACTHNSRYTLKVKIVFEASSLVYMYITSSMKIHSLTILSWFSDFHIIILRHVFYNSKKTKQQYKCILHYNAWM